LIFTVVASHAGIKDLGKVRACIDLIIKPRSDEPHSPAWRIGVPSERLIGRAVEVNVIFWKFAVSAAKTTMNDLRMFY
jgi:hypothetical protein